MMSNSYAKIQERSDVEFQMLRAKIIVEQEIFFSSKDDVDWFPSHIHILLPNGVNESVKESEEKKGLVSVIKSEINNGIEETHGYIKEQSKEISDELKSGLNRIRVNDLKEDINNIARVLEKLDRKIEMVMDEQKSVNERYLSLINDKKIHDIAETKEDESTIKVEEKSTTKEENTTSSRFIRYLRGE